MAACRRCSPYRDRNPPCRKTTSTIPGPRSPNRSAPPPPTTPPARRPPGLSPPHRRRGRRSPSQSQSLPSPVATGTAWLRNSGSRAELRHRPGPPPGRRHRCRVRQRHPKGSFAPNAAGTTAGTMAAPSVLHGDLTRTGLPTGKAVRRSPKAALRVTPPALAETSRSAKNVAAAAKPAIATRRVAEAAGAAGAAAAAVGEVAVTTIVLFRAKAKRGPHARARKRRLSSHPAAMIGTTAARGVKASGSGTTSHEDAAMPRLRGGTTGGSKTGISMIATATTAVPKTATKSPRLTTVVRPPARIGAARGTRNHDRDAAGVGAGVPGGAVLPRAPRNAAIRPAPTARFATPLRVPPKARETTPTSRCPPLMACVPPAGPKHPRGPNRAAVPSVPRRPAKARRPARARAVADAGDAVVARADRGATGSRPAHVSLRRAGHAAAARGGLPAKHGRPRFPGAGGMTSRRLPAVTRRTTKGSSSSAWRKPDRTRRGVREIPKTTTSWSKAVSTPCSTCPAGSRRSAS